MTPGLVLNVWRPRTVYNFEENISSLHDDSSCCSRNFADRFSCKH